MKIVHITLLALLLSMNSFAQTSNLKETSHIEVTGIAEKEIVPNEIYIEICINERMEKGRKVTIREQEAALKKELTSIGVPLENLSISNLNANIAKIGWWREKVLASANYDLKVNDASKLKGVFNAFESLKIKKADIVKATHSKILEFKKQNRINAIKSAKAKADYLLNAIGQKTGKPIRIYENSNGQQPEFTVANYVSNSSYTTRKKIMSSDAGIIKRGNIQFKKIKLISSIYVKFRIK